MQNIGVKDNVPKLFSGFPKVKVLRKLPLYKERIPETIRLQRRRWELYEFESIKEGHRSGRPNTLISDYQAKILDWVNTSPLNAEQIRVKLHEEYISVRVCWNHS